MNDKICGAYIPANGITEEALESIDFGKITHAFLAFSTLKRNKDGIFAPTADGNLVNAVKLVKKRIAQTGCGTKVLISIGGAAAGGFCEASAHEMGRELFARECLGFITEYGIDGIDIDWEFPGLPHEGISACEHCLTDYILLLSAIRNKIGGSLLTAAVGSDHWCRADNASINVLCDLVNVMSYDMNNTAHSAFSLCVNAMNGWNSHGIDACKLVLGVPFYARCVNPKYEWRGYDALMHLVENGEASLLPTEDQDYVLIGDDRLSIDTPRSIKKKGDYVKQNGFAGIFNWQELSDYKGELRRAMFESI